jgi:glycosyltransferase involved in cell wall biosynthesis
MEMNFERPLRILARPARSSLKHNPYTSVLYDEVQKAGLSVVEYRPYRAPFGHWDVLHVHWPESVFDHTLAEALPTTESLLFGARRARSRGARLLWTVHNLRTHEHLHARLEERFWRRFIAELDGVVALTGAGLSAACERFPALAGKPAWIVPHPHYRGQYPDDLDRKAARTRLGLAERTRVMLVFGRMYEYKNVPALLRAVRAAPGEDWAVLVVGDPRNRQVASALREEGGGDPRIHFHLHFVDATDAQLYFRAADLVVQPYREILNSGTALLALSFDRPVLLPRHGAGIDLARDFGPPWVRTYEGELRPDTLRDALAGAATLPERTDGGHVRCIDAAEVGAKMVRAYRELVSQERR